MKHFENDLFEIVKKIKFTKINDEFQAKLKHEITKINSSKHMILQSDKTSNLNEIPKQEYNKSLLSYIRGNYKKKVQLESKINQMSKW